MCLNVLHSEPRWYNQDHCRKASTLAAFQSAQNCTLSALIGIMDLVRLNGLTHSFLIL